jgi:hypothetical protein
MSTSGTCSKTRLSSSTKPTLRSARWSKVLEATITASGGRFRGIRLIAASHPDKAVGEESANVGAKLSQIRRKITLR